MNINRYIRNNISKIILFKEAYTDLLISFIRASILVIIVTFSMKLMGKRQIGQLQPIDLVVAIMVSEVCTIPMQDTSIPLLSGIAPLSALLSVQLAVSYFAKRSGFFRKIVTGSPTVLIYNSRIQINNMKKELLSVTDLMEQLRYQGWHNPEEVHTAILEANGLISVIPKSIYKPTDASMLNYQPSGEGGSYIVVEEGKISKQGLMLADKNEKWLLHELKKFNISDVKDVYFAAVTPDSKLFYQLNSQTGVPAV